VFPLGNARAGDVGRLIVIADRVFRAEHPAPENVDIVFTRSAAA
jgi:hypothetical protein